MADNIELFASVIGKREVAGLVCDYLAHTTRIPTKETLMRIRGVGPKIADRVLSCIEMSRRYILGTKVESVISPETVVSMISFLKYEEQEKTVVVTLDGGNHVIGIHELCKGSIDHVPFQPREIFKCAVNDSAKSVVVAHNHPSGCNEPSDDDLAITRVVCAAGRIMMIPVIDHIIISRSGHTSMCRREPQLFEEYFDKKRMEAAE